MACGMPEFGYVFACSLRVTRGPLNRGDPHRHQIKNNIFELFIHSKPLLPRARVVRQWVYATVKSVVLQDSIL